MATCRLSPERAFTHLCKPAFLGVGMQCLGDTSRSRFLSRIRVVHVPHHGTFEAHCLASRKVDDSNTAPQPHDFRQLLQRTDQSGKWIFLAGTCFALLKEDGCQITWCICGMTGLCGLCQGLKRAIHQPRPKGSIKAGPGMPSGHASAMSFFTAYLYLLAKTSSGSLHSSLLLALLAATILSSGLRCILGYHSAAQIVAGATIGVAWARLWKALGPLFLPSLSTLTGGRIVILAIAVLAATSLIGEDI